MQVQDNCFQNLYNLQLLNMKANQLSYITRGTFYIEERNFTNPVVINVKNNRVRSDQIRADAFLKPKSRKVRLELQQNLLTFIPEHPFKLFIALGSSVHIWDGNGKFIIVSLII